MTEEQRQRNNEYYRRWRAANRDKIPEYTRRAQARKRGELPPFHHRTLEEVFLKHVIRPEAGCWDWRGLKDKKNGGYAYVSFKRRLRPAHRVSYELYVGPIPPGLTIDHLCRNPPCTNPAHLEAVTLRENLRRGVGFVAINARKTSCVHGHPFTPENTHVKSTPKGPERVCRTCNRLYAARKRAERLVTV